MSGERILSQLNTLQCYLDETTKAFHSGLSSCQRASLRKLCLIIPVDTIVTRPRKLSDFFMPQGEPVLILLTS